MGKSFFFINRTKKFILHTEPYNILASIKIAIKEYNWNDTDIIDLFDDIDIDVIGLVEDEGYDIDFKFWD
jgi:hypothetical protein